MAFNKNQYPLYLQILSDLRGGKLAPLYFAMGSEYYLYRQFITELQSAFRTRFGEHADLVQRWGVDLKAVTDVSSLLSGGGLFSSASLVMLHEIQDSGKQVKTNLADLLGKLPPDTVVLVHYSISDFRKAIWLKAMQDVAQVVPLSISDSAFIPRIVRDMATRHELEIDDPAIYRLMELSSGELAIIDNELEKLALYLDDSNSVINRDLVDQVAGTVENAQVEQFIQAFSNRDRRMAIQTLVEIHHQGKEGLPYLVAMLYNRLIQFMTLHETPEARKAIGQGATSNYILMKLQPFSRKYSLTELQLATRELADLDLQFRLGSMDLLTVFSTWVSKVV